MNKGQFKDETYRVGLGPSTRQITDMGDPGRALGIIPTGQSGIPASPHYNDLMPLWREGRYVPLLIDRQAIGKVAAARQVLRP
ncbi:MAG: penicillin acylase family protein [SAR324 cluster bacterium]|nr:penicillin acylase family protein [SAR324 cluster bacterium]